ncbi:MAG: hypothetical protein SFV32_12445 [Opitutaceae bacterium]|nr:hypothetical protein [Opitutaceae bacterium]
MSTCPPVVPLKIQALIDRQATIIGLAWSGYTDTLGVAVVMFRRYANSRRIETLETSARLEDFLLAKERCGL